VRLSGPKRGDIEDNSTIRTNPIVVKGKKKELQIFFWKGKSGPMNMKEFRAKGELATKGNSLFLFSKPQGSKKALITSRLNDSASPRD
jgi:CRISPR/Cas system CMR-associated protein Cmr1 (group 7 of RAMP superfamily)